MFDEFVKEARRLFSSKKNGGKQVPLLTDRLHTLKQVLFALAIVLLIGYAQFREHFSCTGLPGVDKKTVTNFCLINGTTTTVRKTPVPEFQQPLPHTGFHFATNEDDYEVIHHNHMRSHWFIFILLVICSFVAQRNWSRLFQHDFLRAVLRLADSEKLGLVQAVEKARPYDLLAGLSKGDQDLRGAPELDLEPPPPAGLSRGEQIERRLRWLDSLVNIYDHKLDYYPNQLVYMLLTKNASAYKLSTLNIRRLLIVNALVSTACTLLQYLLPLIFVGPDYAYYGLNWAMAALLYLEKLAKSAAMNDNSLDYELSARIFPIQTQCRYEQYSIVGSPEGVGVPCTVAINEIAGKLFVFIWWLIAVNLAVELWMLVWLLASATSAHTVSNCFGQACWPHAKKQADTLATFRHKRALLQAADLKLARLRRQLEAGQAKAHRKSLLGLELSLQLNLESHRFAASGDHRDGEDEVEPLRRDQGERKRLEAEDELSGDGRKGPRGMASCGLADLCRLACANIGRSLCCRAKRRRRHLEKESKRDVNIYYLLYLLHLRLGKSKSCTEEVIAMTARALETYLAEQASAHQELNRQLLLGKQQSQTQQHQLDGTSDLQNSQFSSCDQSRTSADQQPLPIMSGSNEAM